MVHLVWGPLGPDPLREFLASYRAHPAEADHELVMLFNGVSSEARPALEAELSGVEHRVLTLAEPVQDLRAYLQAAGQLEHERLCFLNSHSRILADGWLENLDRALDDPRAGMAGATGSWASVQSGALNGLFLPNPYRGVVPARRIAREQLAAIEHELAGGAGEGGPPEPRTLLGSVKATLRVLPAIPEQIARFERFPAHHLRTNAFMVQRALFASLRIRPIERKMDAYLLESGRQSFTRQVQAMGLRVLVVDREGRLYDQDEWPASRTLWQSDQEGLMVADNQTGIYERGDMSRRELLSAFAWGRLAEPRLPDEVPAR